MCEQNAKAVSGIIDTPAKASRFCLGVLRRILLVSHHSRSSVNL